MKNTRRATYTALRDEHDAREGYPPERYAHDARVAISDYLMRTVRLPDEDLRVLMQAMSVLRRHLIDRDGGVA
jgi:hypothetical protein